MAGFGLYLTGLPNLMKRLKTIEDDLTKGVAQEIQNQERNLFEIENK